MTAVEPADRWESAHELAKTRLCSKQGCEEEADDDDGLCIRCRFRTVPAPCSTPGCDGQAAEDDPLCAACRVRGRKRHRPSAARMPAPLAELDASASTVSASDEDGTTEPAAEKPSYPCKTDACDGTASSSWGRHAFCLPCQIRRGTRAPDGSMILRNPRSPGSRERRDSRKVREQIAGANELAALQLVDAARRLDGALAAVEAARGEADAALVEWQAIVKRLRPEILARPAA